LGKDSKDACKEFNFFLLSLKRSGKKAYPHQNLGQQFFPLSSGVNRILAACGNASTLVQVHGKMATLTFTIFVHALVTQLSGLWWRKQVSNYLLLCFIFITSI
jgi:hypothetical protein